MVHLLAPIERYLRQHLGSDLDRQRFDRARRFVAETAQRGGDIAYRINARWLKFLCSRKPVRTNVWPEDADFLRYFARVFGVPPDQTRSGSRNHARNSSTHLARSCAGVRPLSNRSAATAAFIAAQSTRDRSVVKRTAASAPSSVLCIKTAAIPDAEAFRP